MALQEIAIKSVQELIQKQTQEITELKEYIALLERRLQDSEVERFKK